MKQECGLAQPGRVQRCIAWVMQTIENGFDMADPSSAPLKPARRMVEGRIYSKKMIGYESKGDTRGS